MCHGRATRRLDVDEGRNGEGRFGVEEAQLARDLHAGGRPAPPLSIRPYIVGKEGGRTGMTIGRYNGLEGYTCNEFGRESIEACIYDYDKTSGPFSDHGDSGSLIWTGHGHMVAMLHSGMPRGTSSYVTFGTPMWWIIEQLRLRYHNAVFNRTTL